MTGIHMPTLLIALGVIWIIAAIAAGGIASGRNRDGAIWMTVAFVLGPLTIVPLLVFDPPSKG